MAKEKKMENTATQTVEVKPEDVLKAQTLKPKYKVLDLDAGAEVELPMEYNVYTLKPSEKNGDKVIPAATPEEALPVLLSMLDNSVVAQVEAFIKYVNSQAYQKAKEAAAKGRNVVTPELREKIIALTRNIPKYAELNAGDAFRAWREGYVAKKAGALKILETARQTEDMEF